ncbi:MAG: PAS domain S-box protein [Desulfuromonadales bacterium]
MNFSIFKRRPLETRVILISLAILLISIWSLTFYVSWVLHKDMQLVLGERELSTASAVAADLIHATRRHLLQCAFLLTLLVAGFARWIIKVLLANESLLQQAEERKEALQKSEYRFQSFVENANDVLFTLTPSGFFSYVSPQWKEVFGYELCETIGQPFIPFVHPDDVSSCFAFLQKTMDTGKKQSGIEYRVRCKDGSYVWYTANGAPMTDPVDGTLTFAGIGRDITERRQIEDALRESEQKYRILLDESSDSIFSFSPEARYIYANRAFSRNIGRPVDEITGKSLWDLFPKEEADKRYAVLSRVFSTGGVETLQVCFPAAGGEQHFMTTITPIKNAHGEIISAICSAKNITHLKNTENALREMANTLEEQKHELVCINESLEQRVKERTAELQEKNARFTQLAEHSRTVIWEVDAQGLYTYISSMSESIYGLRPDEVVGRMYFYDMLPASEREPIMETAFEVFALKRNFENFEHGSVFANADRKIWVSTNGIPILDADGILIGYRGSDTDITESKTLKDQLIQSQKMEAVGQLAGGLAHDFNNVLCIINGYCSLLQMEMGQDQELTEYVAKILEASGRAGGLTHHLLAFSRTQVMNSKLQNVNMIVSKVGAFIEKLIGENVQFKIVIEEASLPVTFPDPACS